MPMQQNKPDDQAPATSSHRENPELPPRWMRHMALLRLLTLMVIIVGLYSLAKVSGLIDQANPEGVRDLVREAGTLGLLAYFLMFTLCQLLHVPGLLFIAAAGLLYGSQMGFVYGMTGAMISVTVSFVLVRSIGGRPLANPKRRWVSRMMAALDTRPVITVLTLRCLFSTAPWLNYGLAMSQISYRDYILATFFGVIPQAVLVTFFGDWLMSL